MNEDDSEYILYNDFQDMYVYLYGKEVKEEDFQKYLYIRP